MVRFPALMYSEFVIHFEYKDPAFPKMTLVNKTAITYINWGITYVLEFTLSMFYEKYIAMELDVGNMSLYMPKRV